MAPVEKRHLLSNLDPRLQWGIPLVIMVYGWYQMLTCYDAQDMVGLLMGAGLTVVGGGWLAPLISESLSSVAGRLFHNGDYLDKPPPRYSEVASKRAFGDFPGAIAALWEIVGTHPDELRAWHELLELILIEQQDPAAARHTFLQARLARKTPEDKAQLEQFWLDLQHRAERLALRAREPVTPSYGMPGPEGWEGSATTGLPAQPPAPELFPLYEMPLEVPELPKFPPSEHNSDPVSSDGSPPATLQPAAAGLPAPPSDTSP